MNAFFRRLSNKLPIPLFRCIANLWPPFLGARIKIKKLSPDFRYVEVALKLHWYNSNYVGTHFGGSIFAMTDAFFVMMLIKYLGKGYIVWDKAAKIEYKKPGKGTLTTKFKLNDDELLLIKNKVDELGKYLFDRPIEVVDETGDVVATVVRTLYIRKK